MIKEFNEYLKEQLGQPYLWGGQHTRLTPENYVEVIEKKEAGRGKYPDGTTYAQAAIDFCRAKFDEGATVLYAYDCSGLGCYWLYNLTHLYKCDVNANTMMHRCELHAGETPKRGWWVFRLDGKRASHIGYMIDDEYLIEAKGRKYGVVMTKFREKDWACWGIPNVFAEEIEPQPEPPGPTPESFVEVIGRFVNVRTSDSTKGRIRFTPEQARASEARCDWKEGKWYNSFGEKIDGLFEVLSWWPIPPEKEKTNDAAN